MSNNPILFAATVRLLVESGATLTQEQRETHVQDSIAETLRGAFVDWEYERGGRPVPDDGMSFSEYADVRGQSARREPPMSVEVSAWWQDHDGIHVCNDDPDRATAYGVYIRNPLALHIGDWFGPRHTNTDGGVRCDTVAEAKRCAFDWAKLLAEHLGCECDSQLDQPRRYAIEAQRDMFKGKPEGADGSTYFEHCDEGEATQWAVFDITPGLPGPDLVEDYPSRAAAEQAVSAMEQGGPTPKPVWPVAPTGPDTGKADVLYEAESIVADLHRAVSALHAHYDAHPEMNIYQPAQLAKCFPLSLDEWALELDAARGELREHAEAVINEHGTRQMLEARGYVLELGGGGCTHMVLNRGKSQVMVTGQDGADMPTGKSWMIGIYAQQTDGEMSEALMTLNSEDDAENDLLTALILAERESVDWVGGVAA